MSICIEVDRVEVSYPRLTEQQMSFKRTLGALLGQKIEHVGDYFTALKGVSVSVREGERLGLVGHNGAGKTTLLKVMAGIYPPTQGSVRISGKVSPLLDLAVGFDFDMTGWENIRVRLMLLGYRGEHMQHKVREAGEFSELGAFLDQAIRTYSTGMFVRLAFAVCAVLDPEIMILDEFLGAGDVAFVAKAERRMMELMERGRIVVIASHSLASVKKFCTRALWVDHGRIRGDGPPGEIVAAYEADARAQAA
jgi:lipopolysaccharide transport system ATP-binding protein